MAQRRMFSKSVICSDAFKGMSFAAQSLYLQLCMEADDDGFCSNFESVRKSISAKKMTLDELERNSFVIRFDDGVICIKHWLLNNVIQKDRYKPTEYQEDFRKIYVKPNRIYTISEEKGVPAVRIGKG